MLDLEKPLHEQIEAARTRAACQVPADVRAYYLGQQRDVSAEQAMALGERAVRVFQENIVKRCVDTLAGRLRLRALHCEDEAVAAWLGEWTARNHLARLIVATSIRAITDGTAAVAFGWDNAEQRPIITVEHWWDGTDGVFIGVDETGLPEWAVKDWEDTDNRRRRTVYLPGLILRFVHADGWQPYPDAATGSQAWTKRDGSPLAIPWSYFPYGITADTPYGQSAVAPVLGLQDALNGTIFDVVAAQMLTAMQIYTATGIKPTDRLTVGPGRLWQTEDADAKFSVLPAGEMSALLNGYQALREAIASQFPVPLHIISGGNWPSGMALQRVDSPLVTQVKLWGEVAAPYWVLAAHRSVELANAFGNAGLNEGALITIEYEPAEDLDEATALEIDQAKVSLYASLAAIDDPGLMAKTGLVSEEEARQIVAARQQRAALFGLPVPEPGAGG